MYHVKLAALLFAVSNINIRYKKYGLNILIIGEPKIGKTHFLNSIKKCFDCQYLINCNGFGDNANITLDIVKEGKSESVEAGILTIVNGDILLLDDITNLTKKSISII